VFLSFSLYGAFCFFWYSRFVLTGAFSVRLHASFFDSVLCSTSRPFDGHMYRLLRHESGRSCTSDQYDSACSDSCRSDENNTHFIALDIARHIVCRRPLLIRRIVSLANFVSLGSYCSFFRRPPAPAEPNRSMASSMEKNSRGCLIHRSDSNVARRSYTILRWVSRIDFVNCISRAS